MTVVGTHCAPVPTKAEAILNFELRRRRKRRRRRMSTGLSSRIRRLSRNFIYGLSSVEYDAPW
ncbi:hypothetical protein F8388_010527 [Cannabis sativa]|uniref:Uncharacterized protein n=1 Tax=Cannabis sativa TaxID=3483 RepID=A0A7J6GS83_CANSA|nr:hypothetical protein G4B88_016819 [Cannabis sativa]KAF4384929.1 hypothetical protein F8388_010527 [Cannabis sativa]